jgi:hypothetical protein
MLPDLLIFLFHPLHLGRLQIVLTSPYRVGVAREMNDHHASAGQLHSRDRRRSLA